MKIEHEDPLSVIRLSVKQTKHHVTWIVAFLILAAETKIIALWNGSTHLETSRIDSGAVVGVSMTVRVVHAVTPLSTAWFPMSTPSEIMVSKMQRWLGPGSGSVMLQHMDARAMLVSYT